MMDLMHSPPGSPLLHTVPSDPGRTWTKDAAPAIETPPDSETDPRPEARWPVEARRTGICGAVSPRIVALRGGGYRLYYSQILPRAGFPAGANDYANSTTRILSATSPDGSAWTPEPGVRLSARAGGAGDFRVVSSEVVPLADGRFRMYYECCPGTVSDANSIRSAISSDGIEWSPEPGSRLESEGRNYAAPRIVFLDDGRCRLYCTERGLGMISAVSSDGGLTFRQEPGVRIALDRDSDALVAFAPEILRVGAGYVMYYAGYTKSTHAHILRAVSEDGLAWKKEAEPAVSPGPGGWDAAKCSEMCILRLPHREGEPPRYRMLYEACDGTAKDKRGVWRIASVTSAT
ncbi:MAG: hypothetical protein ACKV22_02435 [Bryobacteraceae bacterium]